MPEVVDITSWRRAGALGIALPLAIVAGGCGGSPVSPPPPPPALVLTCPPAQEGSTMGGAPVALTYTLPSAAGGSAPIAISCVPASGASFPVGATQVNCTAADAAGQTASCNFAVNIVNVPRLTHTRFLVFGNSLSEGKLSSLVESPPHSYPAKLLSMLQERYRVQTLAVLNEGHGGERATASLPRFQSVVSLHKPDVVLIMHGVNDLNTDGLPGVQRAVDAIEELVKHARAAVPVAIVATLPPLGPGSRAGCPECVEPFNARIRSMVSAKGALLADVHAVWGTRTGLMGADGIHPTEAGYEAIAQAFFDAIRAALEAPEPATP